MLREIILRKIYFTTLIIFVLFIVSSFTMNNNSNIKTEYQTKLSSIYLMDDNNYLLQVNVSIKDNINDNILEIFNNLKENNKHYSGLKGIIPKETKINDYKIINRILNIDFNDSLLDVNDNIKEKVIESLVFSYLSFNEIDGVKITVNKQPINELINIDSDILTKDFGINKEYNLTSSENINKTTVYYLNKNNNDYYYIPVTKINNSKKEKVEIIIDELKNNNVYNSYLMSFLNNDVKLISADYNDKAITLNLNNKIYDGNSNSILKEVINTITLSIDDNYNIDEILFKVDNKEIYKSNRKMLE